MKHTFLSLLLAALLLIPTPNRLSASSRAIPLVDYVTRSIVRLDVDIGEEEHPMCTAFVVSASRGEALTAAHCVPEVGDLYVDGIPSHLIRKDESFALIAVPTMNKPPLEVRKEEMKVGEEVWMFGYAWGDYSVFHRIVAAFKQGDIRTDGPLAPGMSGGPVVDAKGDVAGINQAANAVIGIACGVKEIRAFLKQ